MKRKKKNVLIIGSGGREHALAWKMKQSNHVEQIFIAPGNGGTQQVGKNIPISITDIQGLLTFAKNNSIDLTIVGPEIPLELGIVDIFQKEGLKIFGPTLKASMIETSKVFSAEFMKRHSIPSPEFHIFTSYKEAKFFLQNAKKQYVIKADGLAGGKGVIVPANTNDALEGLQRLMLEKEFGKAGEIVILQEKLVGWEISFISICDGTNAFPLLPSQDHKRIGESDTGLNTGGVGAYIPVPFVTPSLHNQILETIVSPTMRGMKNEGTPFVGVLNAGLIVTENGPYVLEYNARFGDPTTIPNVMLLTSDLYEIIETATTGTLTTDHLQFSSDSSACVILTAEGYPGKYTTNDEIFNLDLVGSDVQIFHCGTEYKENKYYTNGGRVINISANAPTVKEALAKIYSEIGPQKIHFRGMHYRKDIGHQVINTSQ
ncbi:MAG: phosphoribosylamine--glycine ligase [Candidatus Roizmanbacteria bacterium]